nr:hypothetical protein CPGR_04931 [Mycolicibacterium malmesburyense]
MTELMITVSKKPCASSLTTWAGRHSNRTRSPHGSKPTAEDNLSMVGAEKSVPQYCSHNGAIWDNISPDPTPISNTRRGPNATTRSTVAARHCCICSSGIGSSV